MLTKGSFAREAWDHLLRLLNIMNFPMFSCSHFLSNPKQSVTSKGAQESTAKEGSAVAKPRPMSLVSRKLLSAKKTPSQDSSASNSLVNQELNQSYVSWSARELVKQQSRTKSIFSRAATRWHSIFGHKRTGAEWWICKLSEHQETGARWWHSKRKDKVESPQYANLRPSIPWKSLQEPTVQIESRRRSNSTQLENQCIDLGQCMSTTMKAAVHLGPNHNENLELHKNTNFEELKNVFDITQRLLLDHEAEILNVSPTDSTAPLWTRSTLMHDQVIKWTQPKSTRQLRFRPMHVKDARAFRSEQKMEWSTWRISTVHFLQRIIWNWWTTDWVRVEYFTWTYLKIQTDLQHQDLEPENLEERIIFMSMLNDIDWTKTGNSERWLSNSEQVKNYADRFSRGHRKFLGPGDEKKWYGTLSYLKEQCDSVSSQRRWGRVKETGHSVFWSISALSRGILKRKRWQRYHTLQAQNSFFAHSANQLSIYGAVSSWWVWGKLHDNQRIKKSRFRTSSQQKRTSSQWKCGTTRSEFFGAKSKERQWSIWKQIARTTSDIGNTGERYPICGSLWRCDIRERSLWWDGLQTGPDEDDRFWTQNPSMQRIHTSSWKTPILGSMSWFQDKLLLDQFFKLMLYDILASAELKFSFLPQQRKIELLGWWYAEG